jgi:hippurate hydrolase
MDLISELKPLHEQMRLWRRHLHQFPETAYEETQTSDYIAKRLLTFGLKVHRGLAETGVVATLSVGKSSRKIALRADMDALFIQEQNEFSYRSCHDGKMHACGHDGHSAMLLGAAKYLAEERNFNGTVYFIFQPAEEGRAGAQRMIEEGLFDQFPADCIFGMHNFPDIPQGHFVVKSGPMMAAFDCFEIQITGQASHAAMPHLGHDPILAAGQLIQALQSIVSRNVNPDDSAVLSLTQIHAGETWNAIPEAVTLRGTYRCFKPEVKKLIKQRIEQICHSICSGFEMTAKIIFNPENPGYPVTFNHDKETQIAIKAAKNVVGETGLDLKPVPSMGSEDFAFMLQEKPGCYIWIGNGPSSGNCLLHNPHYDFNDEILPIGAAYWVSLVQNVCDGI